MVKEAIKFFLSPKIQLDLAAIKRKVYNKMGALKAEYICAKEPIPFNQRKDEPLKAIRKAQAWSRDSYDCGWFHFTGTVPIAAQNKHIGLLVAIGAEGCLFDDEGNPKCGISSIGAFMDALQPVSGKRLFEVSPMAEGDENIDIWVECGNNVLENVAFKAARYKQGDIVAIRDDIREYYYDYLYLAQQMMLLNSSDPKYKSINRALSASKRASRNYDEASVAAAREIIAAEFAKGEPSKFTVYATGHAHLDLAWLWPIRETQRKAVRTFTNALRNIEKNDGYIFGASQPQQFEWIENKYPELFAELKKAIQGGAIECQGGMWVECDTNVTGGESLIRQNLYGTRYWKEKFGKEVKICWLPDVFGFSGNLPQILKKCGMDYFLTIKLSWNEHNKFPKRSFLWEGIDDSKILVHMPPEGNYNSDGSPWSLDKGIKEYPEKDVSNYFGMLYGVGDGGGGPSEGHIAMASRGGSATGLPKVIMSPAIELFNKLDGEKDKFETFKGELYLEKHQGTYTTQGKNKLLNRKIENMLHNVEFLATAATAFGMVYPKEKLDAIWKEILLYQFHDIIPGSSIKRVYDESVARYEKINAALLQLQNEALDCLKVGERPCCVNTTSYAIKDIVRLGEKMFVADVAPYAAAELCEYREPNVMSSTADTIESDLFLVKFDFNGNIIGLLDKNLNKDFAAGAALNKLNVYRDKRLHYNAWDIDINYTKIAPDEFKLIGSNTRIGNGYVVRENIYSYNHSTITQQVTLKAGKPIVEFSAIIDWQETHKMLRSESFPTVFAEEVTCDIQMGNIKRSTKDKTAVEKAQFEICAHKWIDVSADGYGFSVLSDCKYGWRVKEGLISLNLLRSPMFPAKNADKGTHHIKYAFYPHAGDVYEAETAKHGYLFNNPLIVTGNAVALPSFINCDTKNIVIETIKTAESGNGIIIRAYEDSGRATTCGFRFSKPYSKAYETDMLENVIREVDLSQLAFKPFEIITLFVQ